MSVKDYWLNWKRVRLDPKRNKELQDVANQIMVFWPLYTKIKETTGVPEYITGCIDYREESFDHRCYLANGDPLFNSDGKGLATRHEPRGLGPVDSWESGAVLSLKHDGLDLVRNWSISHSLYTLEAYNGFGYAHMKKLSPYLWAGTSLYSCGKYEEDGRYNPMLADKQLGCVAILQALRALGVDLNETEP